METIKKNALWVFALIGMLLLGTAVTVYVSSDFEAAQAFSTTPTIEKGTCEPVTEPSKQATTLQEWQEAKWTTHYNLHLKVNGENKTIPIRVETEQSTTEAIQTQAAIDCEAKALEEITKIENEQKQVIWEKTATGIMTQYYDLLKKKWETITTTEPEPPRIGNLQPKPRKR